MNFYISYFYNISFFPVSMLPVSTAVYDPKWYHNFRSKDVVFRDKRSVINGVRADILSPYKIENCECRECTAKDPTKCSFIRDYRSYLFSLDFNSVYESLLDLSKRFKCSDICLMVYEKPDNPCSERSSLIEWFSHNGVELKEFSRDSFLHS